MRCSDRAAADYAARQAIRKQAGKVRRGDSVQTADHGLRTVVEVGHIDDARIHLDIGTHVLTLWKSTWVTVIEKEVVAN